METRPMQMRFGADDIIGHRVLADGSGIGIMFKSGEDEIELLLPTRNVQGMFTILADILVALQNINAPLEGQRVNARFPVTASVSISPETTPPSVVLIFDANRPTQAAMAIGMAAARKMGHELISKAREAEKLLAKPQPLKESTDGADRPVQGQ